ncbi:MAG: PPC domain-containing protein [Candidatus Thorarchaeota archaeon]
MKRSNAIYAVVMIGLIVTALAAAVTFGSQRPVPVVLDENATFSGYIENEGAFRLHSIRIFENVTRIHLVLNCPGNDFDIYGRLGELPSLSEYNFRGYQNGGEDLNYYEPESGIWHLMVRSYSGIGHYDLIIEFEYE